MAVLAVTLLLMMTMICFVNGRVGVLVWKCRVCRLILVYLWATMCRRMLLLISYRVRMLGPAITILFLFIVFTVILGRSGRFSPCMTTILNGVRSVVVILKVIGILLCGRFMMIMPRF